MKLAFVIASLDRAGGGPPNEVANLTAALIERGGAQVRILAFATPDPVNVSPNIELMLLPSFTREPWAVATTLRRVLVESDFVFVWGVWGLLEGLLFRMLRPASCRYAVKTLGMLEPYILSRNRGRKAIAKLLYLRSNLLRASAILVDSEPEGRRMMALGLGRTFTLCRNGVRPPYLAATARSATNLLYLGRIVPKKGLDFMLEVMALLVVKHPRLRLLIAGEFGSAEYEEFIRDRVRKLELDLYVEFLGSVVGKSKDLLMQSVAGFVLPSHSEGFSNAVLEALAAGTPVFITPECNFPEVEAERLGRVIPRVVDTWVRELDAFLQDPLESRLLLAQQIRRHMEQHFSWANAAQQAALVAENGIRGQIGGVLSEKLSAR